MLRAFFIFLSRSKKIRDWIPKYRITKRISRRFVAGETIEDALRVIEALQTKGMRATLDLLGENVDDEEAAKRASKEYADALSVLKEKNLPSGISVKLTHIGLDLSRELALENLRNITKKAQETGRFVRIDMESSDYTDVTIEFYHTMRKEFPQNIGIVFQAYLYRTEDDIKKLLKEGPVNVRLCKGAYKEPPDRAFPKKKDVDKNFVNLLKILLDPGVLKDGSRTAIATHDEKIISWSEGYIKEKNLEKNWYEYQMLYGIRRDLQEYLAQKGEKVRIYVPYGIEWYPYFMRRLAERPANVLFILKNLLKP